MILSPHFFLFEFFNSVTAKNNHIYNETDDPDIIKSLQTLCLSSLEPIRLILCHPIIITSGYRCQQLNDLVSKNPNSQHRKGEAADFIALPKDMTILENMAIKHSFPFDQLILYPSRNFIHVSFTNKKQLRYQILYR